MGIVHEAVVDFILDVLLKVGVWVAADGLPAGLWLWKCSLGADGGGGGGGGERGGGLWATSF